MSAIACKKEIPYDLNVFTLNNISNAIVQNAKCGIDLETGTVYTIEEGKPISGKIDIAYGYCTIPRERGFLAISYAGCHCGGAVNFCYGDNDNPLTGFSSYDKKNITQLLTTQTALNFNEIKNLKTKAALDKYFPLNAAFSDEAYFSVNDNIIAQPYVFFTTASGKRGIIHVKPYTKDFSPDYYLHENSISIEIIIER
ncbi:MAG: hypothetical protein ACKOWL_02255 [Sphingobacteriaceae bacterium]